MPITKAIVTKVFDPNWAVVGSVVRITGKDGVPINCFVVEYEDEYSKMVVIRLDEYGDPYTTSIHVSDLDRYVVERLIPESKDTVDLEYVSLMNKCDGIADRTIKDSESIKFAHSAVIPIDRDA